MIYVIMSSDVARNQSGRTWQSKAAVFITSYVLAGASAGCLLGLVGGMIPLDLRASLATLAAVGAIILGGLEARGHRVRIPQRNCEVPQRLMQAGAWMASFRYGSRLGLGATSRIGFALWYAVPIAAILSGEALLGLVTYGLYALVRGAGPWLILAGAALVRRRKLVGREQAPLWLLARAAAVRQVTGVQLLALGVAVVLAQGL